MSGLMFIFKPSLNLKLFRDCRDLNPTVYKAVCKAVTSKPGKVGVKVEELEVSE